MSTLKIGVVGTGYVGLVAAACFARAGHEVVCADIDQAKIESLRRGVIPIHEPGLEELVLAGVKAYEQVRAIPACQPRPGTLQFTTSNAEAAAHADILFLAVGTPTVKGGGGSADLSYLITAAQQCAPHLGEGFTVVVNKSTVPVGTAERVDAAMRKTCGKAKVYPHFSVASNPEFLREGSAVKDFMAPDRVVVGTDLERARLLLRELYSPIVDASGGKIFDMSTRSAELTKYAANSYLAARISFINDIANLCDATGASVEDVRDGMASDQRIGPHFLSPGVGYGGSCFPKDVRALLHTARAHGVPLRLVAAAEQTNEAQKLVLFRKVKAHFGELSGLTFAVWGLSFKPNTDDVREASSLATVRELVQHGARVRVHDPVAGPAFMAELGDLPGVELVDNRYDACDGCDALIVLTEWDEYRRNDYARLKTLLNSHVIFDGRNCMILSAGFQHIGIGL